MYNLSPLPFFYFYYTFTLFGINWNHRILKKSVQDITSNENYQNEDKINICKHPDGSKAAKRNSISAKNKKKPTRGLRRITS